MCTITEQTISLSSEEINEKLVYIGEEEENEKDYHNTLEENQLAQLHSEIEEEEQRRRNRHVRRVWTKDKKRERIFRKADFYLQSEKRRQLAEELRKKARKYKISFERAEEICDRKESDHGSMVYVNAATRVIKGLDPYGITNIPGEAMEAGKDLIEMQEVMKEMTDDGVPIVACLEVKRQILEKDIPEANEYLVIDQWNEEEEE